MEAAKLPKDMFGSRKVGRKMQKKKKIERKNRRKEKNEEKQKIDLKSINYFYILFQTFFTY